MHDARDAEDSRLLEAGEYTLLVESYYGVILDRCRARVRPEADAIGVAAEVAIRLLSELKRGRRYRVPFRVVVHKVIGWKVKEHFEPAKLRGGSSTTGSARRPPSRDAELAADPGFDALLDGLTELERGGPTPPLRRRPRLPGDRQEARQGAERRAPDPLPRAHEAAEGGGMTEARMELLFDEFATRYLRGERPTCASTSSAPATSADELGSLLDRFLQAVPARAPTEEEIVLTQARLEQEPPLLVLRLRSAPDAATRSSTRS